MAFTFFPFSTWKCNVFYFFTLFISWHINCCCGCSWSNCNCSYSVWCHTEGKRKIVFTRRQTPRKVLSSSLTRSQRGWTDHKTCLSSTTTANHAVRGWRRRKKNLPGRLIWPHTIDRKRQRGQLDQRRRERTWELQKDNSDCLEWHPRLSNGS